MERGIPSRYLEAWMILAEICPQYRTGIVALEKYTVIIFMALTKKS